MNLQKKRPEYVYLTKKLTLFEEVAIFSMIIFKIRQYLYCEILQFSGIFGLDPVVWAMRTVNLQKNWSEYDYLKKKLSLFKEVAIFSIISFKIGFIGTVKYCSFPAFLL